MRRWSIAAVLPALLLAGGAGSKKTLHWRAIEEQLAAKLGTRESPIADVACDESEVRAGTRFPCRLHFADGATTQLHIELTDQAGSWRMVEGFAYAGRMAQQIQKTLHDQYKADAIVDCGKDLLLSGHHGCEAHAASGESAHLDVEVHDDGTASWHAVKK